MNVCGMAILAIGIWACSGQKKGTANEQVTTVITATEPVRFVDISTDKVAGDQPIKILSG